MTLVKIDGITSWRDAEAAVDAGADHLGFFCGGGGARSISVETYRGIAARLPPHVQQVGVFAGSAADDWKDTPSDVIDRFHLIEYYDDAVWPQIIRENWDMRRKIKGFHVTSDRDLRTIAAFNGLVQNIMLNIRACAPIGYRDSEAYGWELAREVRQFGKRIYLAGGLSPENVARAISRVHPYAVNVMVAVESEPGVKDEGRMREFVRAVRAQDKR